MKSFNEATAIFRQNMVMPVSLDNPESLKELEPFREWGISEGATALAFLEVMDKEIQKPTFCTKDLLDFAVNFPNKGIELSFCILKSIREAAGFTTEHIDYLTGIYQRANSYEVDDGPYSSTAWGETRFPDKDTSRKTVERLIELAVMGVYKRELLSCLKNNELKSKRHDDCGQKLLNHLNSMILKSKMEFSKSECFKSLHQGVNKIENLGKTLLSSDAEKAKIATDLAAQLRGQLTNFSNDSQNQTIEDFISTFKKSLHDKDLTMNQHRQIWKPIITNILIALTGIGTILLLGRAIYSFSKNNKLTFNSTCFFARTRRQELVEELDDQLSTEAMQEFLSPKY